MITQCDVSSVICANTSEIYATIERADLLTQGIRYYFCLLGTDNADLSGSVFIACSDGITVDLDPPKVGLVLMGYFNANNNDRSVAYQSSSSELLVRWNGFSDDTGISYYECGIGKYFALLYKIRMYMKNNILLAHVNCLSSIFCSQLSSFHFLLFVSCLNCTI